MKKRFIYFAAVFACVGCAKENPATFNAPAVNPTEQFAIEASNASKTVMNDVQGSEINWSEGDKLTVFDNQNDCPGHTFTSSVDKQNPKKAVFSGEVCLGATSVVAVYPCDAQATFSAGIITTTLPSVQTAVNGSFANGSAIALSKATRTPGQESAQMSFTNLCSVLSFNIPSYIEDAVSVEISSNASTTMSGNVSIDVENCAITSVSGGSSVTLSGDFVAGGQYYACMAPGQYVGGFTLNVSTASGKSYSCSTTKTMDAQAANIYYLGTLGLVLDIKPVVTITHTVDQSGLLNGSTAQLTMTGLGQGLDSLATQWSVSLLNSDSTQVRRIFTPEGTMSVANSYKYIPQGNYTVVASYTLPDGKTRTVCGTATSPAPSFTLKTEGYTTYDCAKGTNGCTKDVSKANSLDACTIYAMGASVSITNELLSDSKYSSSFNYSIDAIASVSVYENKVEIGDLTGQSWAQHKLCVNCSFDGVSESQTRELNVTGLPYRVSSFSEDGTCTSPQAIDNLGNHWVAKSWNNQVSDNSLQCGGTSGSNTAAWRSDFALYVPTNIDVTLECPSTLLATRSWIRTTFTGKVNNKEVFSHESPKASGIDPRAEEKVNLSGNGTLTPGSKNEIYFDSSYTAAGPWVQVHYVNLIYR